MPGSSAAHRCRTGGPALPFVIGAVLLALAACRDATAPSAAPAPPPDVTAAVEHLGNPFATPSQYARNVWDMQRFGGRIYLGHGDAIDNAGPIPIWSLDPATGQLASEFATTEEEIESFRVLGGELYVPGTDPQDDWSLGNFYRLEAGGWVKHRTIPHGLHTFDLALRNGRLYAALGAEDVPGEETLMASADRGETWTTVSAATDRIYAFLDVSGGLYGEPGLEDDPSPDTSALYRFDGARFVRSAISGGMVMRGLPPHLPGRIMRPTDFDGQLIYIVAAGSFSWYPVALAATRTLADTRRIALPDSSAVPFDLLVRGTTLYVLAGEPEAAGGFTVSVYSTADLQRWRELFHLSAPTFARSFEEQDGDFFLGLGSRYQAPSAATGDLLRVRRASYGR